MNDTKKALDVEAIEQNARSDYAHPWARIALALCARVREVEAALREVVATNDAMEEDDSPEAFFNREAALVHARAALAPRSDAEEAT